MIVAYLSRLTRRVGHTIEIWDRVVAAGGRFISAREELDTAFATPQTKAYRNRDRDRGRDRDPETRQLVPNG